MEIERTHTILYVTDQEVSTEFYEELLQMQPHLNVPGMTEFKITENFILGLMPEESIAKVICPVLAHPQTAHGIPRCELYFYVSDLEGEYSRLQEHKIVSPLEKRNWGDTTFYIADPDGHIIALAKRT
jgi:lactoylglutathione lyase